MKHTYTADGIKYYEIEGEEFKTLQDEEYQKGYQEGFSAAVKEINSCFEEIRQREKENERIRKSNYQTY